MLRYRGYMHQQQGALWNTTERKTHLEYQTLLSDRGMESEYRASQARIVPAPFGIGPWLHGKTGKGNLYLRAAHVKMLAGLLNAWRHDR